MAIAFLRPDRRAFVAVVPCGGGVSGGRDQTEAGEAIVNIVLDPAIVPIGMVKRD